jgi:hypothetical protein
MDTIPPEILHQILLHIPKDQLATCRLVNHSFSSLAFPIQFSFIPHWLDYNLSHQAIVALAQDAFNRPAVMWSPFALEPQGPVESVWMEIVWKFLTKSEPPRTAILAEKREGEEGENIALTSGNFAQLSGREDITENRLRTSQNRYLLHRKYAGRDVGCLSPFGSHLALEELVK